MGNKARQRERETGRERFGERGRETQQWEKMVWVDFDRRSKSTTPANAQHLRISRGCQSIRTTEGLDVNQTLGGVWYSLTILGASTFARITLGQPQSLPDHYFNVLPKVFNIKLVLFWTMNESSLYIIDCILGWMLQWVVQEILLASVG